MGITTFMPFPQPCLGLTRPSWRAQLTGGEGQRWKGQLFPNKPYPLQVIDTVPLGEVADDMFGYFEPLYQVIPDMPRPPETFLQKVTGQAPQDGRSAGAESAVRFRLRLLVGGGSGVEGSR